MTDQDKSENDTQVREDHSRIALAWHWYKKMTMLPSSMGRYQAIGKVAYLLMSAIALYMVIIITLDDNVFTDVNELPNKVHILPDVIMCPYATSVHLRGQTTTINDTSVRDPYNRKYLVWYLRENIEEFEDFADGELDALAAYMRNKTKTDRTINETLTDRAGTLYSSIKQFPQNEESHKLASVAELYENGKTMEALWHYLAVPPAVDKLNVEQLQCWPYLEGTVDYGWCKRVAEPIWIENSYCVLFPFQTMNVSSWEIHWNIKHYFFDWNASMALGLSEGLGVKLWMGNFQLQNVVLRDLWTMYPKENDCYAYNDYEAYKIIDTHNKKLTVCQDSIIFLENSSFSLCSPQILNEYWMFKIALKYGCSLDPWFYPIKIIHTTIRPTLNTVQRVQLYGGVFGFSTGFSVLQLLELFTRKLSERGRKKVIRIVEILIMVLMTAIGCWFAVTNLQELVSISRFVRTSEYKLLHTEPFNPHVALGRANLKGMTMLNHSRLAEHNISLQMLRYLTGQSGITIKQDAFYVNYFLDKPKNKNISRIFSQKLRSLPRWIKEIEDSVSSYVKGVFTSEMDDQFKQLAVRMGFSNTVPPYKIYEQFRVDLCALIKYCQFDQNITIDNCCQYARYETMHRHVWSDAIMINFPEKIKLNQSGVTHGLEIYFDADIFTEANFEYIGPDQLQIVREFQFTRVGLKFSELRLMIFDGMDPEQQFFGRTNIQLQDLQSNGKIMNAGFILSRTKRLQTNAVNKCREANKKCRSLSYGNKGSTFLARALAEKTMCNCHVCHSSPPNLLIAKMCENNGCCTAQEATRCYNQPIKCCQNGAECCFDAIANKNQTCTVDGRLLQTLLYNVEGESGAKCSMEYEVADIRAAESGSVVAQRISTGDRTTMQDYMLECKKTICDRKNVAGHRVNVVINSNAKTAQWFGVRIYIGMETIMTSSEEDRFSVLEAGLQLLGGFGLLFGVSILTVFEVISATFEWIRNKSRNLDIREQNRIESFHSACLKIIAERAVRSIDVFSNEKDHNFNKNKDSLKVANTGIELKSKVTQKEDYHQNKGGSSSSKCEMNKDEEDNVVSVVHAVACLVIGFILAVYSVYLLYQLFAQDNTEAKNEVSFNGTLSPPSIAFCVPIADFKELSTKISAANCKLAESTALLCLTYFTIRLTAKNTTCLIHDFTKQDRVYEAQKKRFNDFHIQFPRKNSSGGRLTMMNLWFGYLPSVRDGLLSPMEPWALSKSTEFKYKLLKSTLNTNCDPKQYVKTCEMCKDIFDNSSAETLCCMIDAGKQIPNLLNKMSMSPCRHDYHSVEMKETDIQNEEWVELKLIDFYGVIELRTLGKRNGWSIVLSNFGTIIDTFVGVTFLNVLCVVILAVTLLIGKSFKYMRSVFVRALVSVIVFVILIHLSVAICAYWV